MSGINAELVKLAAWRAHREKQGFVPSGPPPGGDPAAMGGAPPMDPAMMGGAPPGAPPMDPAMMGGGGAPPMDPAMMGGAPPGPPVDPAMLAAMGGGIGGGGAAGGGDVRSIIREELSGAGLLPQGGKAGAGGKAPKPDINTIATDVFQLKKMFLHFLRIQGIELPPDILDGPNRDPLTGAPATSPTGGSDVQPGSSGGGAGPQSAIQPIEPMQGAFPMGGGGGGGGGGGIGGEKTSGVRVGQEVSGGRKVMSKAAAVAQMFKQRREVESA